MKNKIILGFAALAMLSGVVISTQKTELAASAAEQQTLRIYNWEDYIYSPEKAEETESIIKQFEQATGVKVTYNTFATNEEMLNKITKLNHKYDLICPSDYVIQKLIREDKLEKFDINENKEYEHIPNYSQYASHYMKNLFDEKGWSDYAVGYMWGTMGLIYNPAKVEEVDMQTWMSLYDIKYKNKISVKDSMRETYLVGIIKAYRDDLLKAKAKLDDKTYTPKEYNDELTRIINLCEKENIEKVETELKTLSKNVYGFEVDSGKNDITTGKININLAWSGDAVYAMDLADEEGLELKYAVPEEGSNIWFDGWVMPKGAKKDLAQLFLDFISNPDMAVLNMNYIGYTSFIAGDAVLDMVKDNYEVEADIAGATEVDLSYFFEGTLSEGRNAIITTDATNRQLYAQYSDEETINRCAIMEDFGAQNENVVAMWTRVRANEISTWLYVGLAVVVVGGISIAVYFYLKNKNNKKRIRAKARR